MKKFFTLFLLLISVNFAFSGGAGTKFQMYVPPTNENVNRPVCMVITAFTDSTSFVLTDDNSDGDNDDSFSGMLMRGQSYVCYMKDGAVNDDAGGKWDGDYFTVTSTKPVIVYQAVNSDWEHDFIPSDNGTMTGNTFFIYVNTSPFSNRDINVFTYFDSTNVRINDISVSGSNNTGLTSVNPLPNNNLLVNKNLNIKEDLIYTSSTGINLLNNGKSYMITTSKPVSVQYGALYTNAREAGAFVPGLTGSTLDSLFYFNIPSDYKKEQELRIASYSNNVTLKVEWLNNGTNWVQLQSYNLNQYSVGNFLDNGNQNEQKLRAYTNGGKVSIFEGNYLQSSNGATSSDIYTYAASDRGNNAGKNLVVYLPQPSNISNCVIPGTVNKYTTLAADGLFSHLFIYANYNASEVRIRDNNLSGIIDTTVNLSAGKFYDFRVNKVKYNQLSNNGSTIPYLRVTSTQPVNVAACNWSTDWMCFANDAIADNVNVINNTSKTDVTTTDTCSYFAYLTNRSGVSLTATSVTVTIPDGLEYQSSTFTNKAGVNLGAGTYTAGTTQSTIKWSGFSFTPADTLRIKITGKGELNYYTGNPIPNNTSVPISTILKGNALTDTLSAQNSSSVVLKNSNPNTQINNYVLAFEDIKNSAWNDWDVNDFVASMKQTIISDLNLNITKITYEYEALARGSSFDHVFKHKINLTGSTTTSLTVYDTLGNIIPSLSFSSQGNTGAFTTTIFPSSKAALPPAGGLFSTNTSPLQLGVKKGYKAKLEITVNNTNNPLSGFTNGKSDPYIITSVGGEIHVASIAGPSGNTQNLDNASLVGQPLYGYYLDLGYQNPNNFKWPLEGPAYPIWVAYPRFTSYITSSRTANTDWYNFPDTTKVWKKRVVTTDEMNYKQQSNDRYELINKGTGKRIFEDSIAKFFASPKYSDLDGDGIQEVIIGAMDKRMYAFRSNGEIMTGFPFPTDGLIRSTAAIDSVNINGTGKKVIVFGSDDGNLFAIDNAGNLLKGFPFYTGASIKSSPVIADIYNDGNKEIIIFSGNGKLFVLGFDGQVKSGFPVKVQKIEDSYGNLVILPSPAIGDIDNDGSKEIVLGTADSTLNVVRADGSIQQGFPVKLDNVVYSSPLISKLNGNNYNIVAASSGGYLYLLKPDGSVITQRQLAQGFISSPVIADMNRDSTKEILIAGTDGNILSINPNTALDVNWNMQTITEINSSPVVADVDGDGFTEVVYCGMNGTVFVINKDGVMDLNTTNLFGLFNGWIISSPSIGDLDGNGKLDITIASLDETIKTYELPNSTSSSVIQWQFFGKDLANTRFDGVNNNVSPAGNQLGQIFNYPNPVKESTTLIRAELPIETQDIKLQIYDMGGQLVKSVSFKEFTRNGFFFDYRWDLKNERGVDIANGAYIYIIKAKVNGNEYSKSQKMGVVR